MIIIYTHKDKEGVLGSRAFLSINPRLITTYLSRIYFYAIEPQ